MMNFPVLQTCFVPFEVQELVLEIWLKEKGGGGVENMTEKTLLLH